MIALCIAVSALAAMAAAWLVWPIVIGGSARDCSDARQVHVLSLQLAQLSDLHRVGALSDEAFAASRAVIAGKVLGRLGEPGDGAVATIMSSRMAAAIALAIVAIAALGYAWLGSPAGPAAGASPVARSPARSSDVDSSSAGASTPHPLVPEQVAAMVEQLVERLKGQPDDADGWTMLARSQVVLGRHAQAVDAFKEAARLRPDDAGLLADYADALAVALDQHLDGEPMKLIERALAIEPSNAKALALAGSAAFDRHDYAAAVRHWETLVRGAPEDDAFAQQFRAGIGEARRLAGLPPAEGGASSIAAAKPRSDAAVSASVGGTVSLAPSLRGRVNADDTLFVYARAVDGGPMPLAILRRQVRDLPLQFTLDDTLAMSPSARLSGAGRVIVGARISKSGDATPQSGDLQGMIGAASVGSTGLRVEINQEVKR